MVALAAHSCPEANPFSRKGRVGEDKPPHVPMVHGPQRPRQDRRPSATSPAATAPTRRTPHATRHTHLLVTSVISSSSSPPDTMLSSSSLIVVGRLVGRLVFASWGLVVFVRSSLGINFYVLWPCQSISQGRPHDFGRGAGGEGGGYAPHHAASKEYVYVPSVRTLRYTYIHTYH